jgi:cytoplasmic iron level regulating protein YaaA (DUF328/UPF0246 family)
LKRTCNRNIYENCNLASQIFELRQGITYRSVYRTFFKGIKTDSESTEKESPKNCQLMHISDKFRSKLEAQSRLDNPFSPENARLQLYFDGDVYSGLDTYSIPLDKLETLQDSLRILSVCMDLKPLI